MSAVPPLANHAALTPPQDPTDRVCVPGRDGVPDSVLGEVLCGTWTDDVTHLVLDRWPLLVAAIATVIGARLGWGARQRRVWRAHASHARWLQITPPVTATPAATVGLWRLLATVLPAPRRFAFRPARLVCVACHEHGTTVSGFLPR